MDGDGQRYCMPQVTGNGTCTPTISCLQQREQPTCRHGTRRTVLVLYIIQQPLFFTVPSRFMVVVPTAQPSLVLVKKAASSRRASISKSRLGLTIYSVDPYPCYPGHRDAVE